MIRYIDADKLRKDEIARCHCVPVVGSGDNNYKDLDEVLNEQPAADVVEVVKCKDCKHYCLSDFRKPNEPRWCELINDGYFYPKEDFYCGFGERREK